MFSTPFPGHVILFIESKHTFSLPTKTESDSEIHCQYQQYVVHLSQVSLVIGPSRDKSTCGKNCASFSTHFLVNFFNCMRCIVTVSGYLNATWGTTPGATSKDISAKELLSSLDTVSIIT